MPPSDALPSIATAAVNSSCRKHLTASRKADPICRMHVADVERLQIEIGFREKLVFRLLGRR